MALDANDREAIRNELNRVQDALSAQIKLVEKDIQHHLTDRFAHGWDHNQLAVAQETMKDWTVWRDGINRWRWMITGALVVTAVEAPLIATLAAAVIHH